MQIRRTDGTLPVRPRALPAVRAVTVPRAVRRPLVPPAGAAAALAFVAALVVLAYRAAPLLNIPGQPDGIHIWMADFRDAIYYPITAFLDGVNPYDPAYAQRYPVYQYFPIYSPLTLLVHLPFALLPFVWAELAYAVATIGLLVATVYLALGWVGAGATWTRTLAISAAVLLTRPGYLDVLLGQSTLQVTLAVYLALYAAPTRPWLAAVGLALATIKPTYGVPLALLLLARGDVALVARGAVLAGVPTLFATAVLAHQAGGFGALLATVPANYAATLHDDPVANAATSAIRVDLVALISRVTGSAPGPLGELVVAAAVLAAAGLAMRRLARWSGSLRARNLSAALACLALLLCSYHQNYDLLLLVLPVLAVAAGDWPLAARRPWLRGGIAMLLVVPFLNHLLSGRGLSLLAPHPLLYVAVTSLNGAALLLAFGLCLWLAARAPRALWGTP